MDNEKKSKKNRSGFLGIKLTEEALSYQVDNYYLFSGFSSERGKASLVYTILLVLGWVSFIGENQAINQTAEFIMLLVGLLISLIIYKWPRVGISMAFFVLLINIIFIFISEPTSILGAFIALYIFAYFLYPAYQVESKIKQKVKNT